MSLQSRKESTIRARKRYSLITWKEKIKISTSLKIAVFSDMTPSVRWLEERFNNDLQADATYTGKMGEFKREYLRENTRVAKAISEVNFGSQFQKPSFSIVRRDEEHSPNVSYTTFGRNSRTLLCIIALNHKLLQD